MEGTENIVFAGTSDKIRLTTVPYIVVRLKGDSYINQRAASLLSIEHGDMLRFLHTEDCTKWWITNDPEQGARIKRNAGLYKFCDVKNARKLLRNLGVRGDKAHFPLSGEVEELPTPQGTFKILFVIPKPYNQEIEK